MFRYCCCMFKYIALVCLDIAFLCSYFALVFSDIALVCSDIALVHIFTLVNLVYSSFSKTQISLCRLYIQILLCIPESGHVSPTQFFSRICSMPVPIQILLEWNCVERFRKRKPGSLRGVSYF